MGGVLIQNSRIMESEENATLESGSGLFLTLGFGTSGNLKPIIPPIKGKMFSETNFL